MFENAGEFLARLRFFLKRIEGTTIWYAIETGNKNWLDETFGDLLSGGALPETTTVATLCSADHPGYLTSWLLGSV